MRATGRVWCADSTNPFRTRCETSCEIFSSVPWRPSKDQDSSQLASSKNIAEVASSPSTSLQHHLKGRLRLYVKLGQFRRSTASSAFIVENRIESITIKWLCLHQHSHRTARPRRHDVGWTRKLIMQIELVTRLEKAQLHQNTKMLRHRLKDNSESLRCNWSLRHARCMQMKSTMTRSWRKKSRWIMQLKMITIHKLLVLQPRVVSAKLRGDYMMYDTKAKLLSPRSPSSLCAIIKGEIINQSGSMAVIALNTCHTWYTHSTHYDERWRRKVFRF